MAKFLEIPYDTALTFFEEAEENGYRWRMGDFSTAKWLQRNNVNFDEIVAFSKNMPDSKIVLIGEGASEGFYIYSQKQKTCYKFEQKLTQV
jgi:hypothetical protein